VVVKLAVAAMAAVTLTPDDLLRRSDVGAFAPASFSAQLRLTRAAPASRHEIELWRSGRSKTLVRFLDPDERGRYLIRIDSNLWLLTPGARSPVRLNTSYRMYGGATLDEVLGLQLALDYSIDSASEGRDEEGPTMIFELRARSDTALFPRVRYVVRPATERPVTALYRVRSGREATAVEFMAWNDTRRLYARRVVVRDLLRKGAVTEVDVLDLQERPVPDALFDLADDSARRAQFP
jgi:hypothetical protein